MGFLIFLIDCIRIFDFLRLKLNILKLLNLKLNDPVSTYSNQIINYIQVKKKCGPLLSVNLQIDQIVALFN